MKDYAFILKEQIRKKKIENPSIRLGKPQDIVDLLFPIINDMLNERDPRLVDEISYILSKPYGSNYKSPYHWLQGWNIRNFLEGKEEVFSIGKESLIIKYYHKYGINIINGEDALKRVYGNFDRLSGIRSKDSPLTNMVRKKGIILYKSLQNLDEYTRKNSEKQEMIIVNWFYKPEKIE